jgi:hypothetical protein
MYVSRAAQYADVLLVFPLCCRLHENRETETETEAFDNKLWFLFFFFNGRNLDFFGFVLRFARPI